MRRLERGLNRYVWFNHGESLQKINDYFDLIHAESTKLTQKLRVMYVDFPFGGQDTRCNAHPSDTILFYSRGLGMRIRDFVTRYHPREQGNREAQ